MFQFRRFPSHAYFVQRGMTAYCAAGLPHSEIPGSMDICSSPRLFAACHVLRRLLMPRHSPCALSSLTCSSQPAPLLLAFRRKQVFGELRRELRKLFPDLLRGVRESWFSLRITQAFHRFEIVCHPASFRMLFHNQFSLPSHSCEETSLLPYFALSHCSVFKVQGSNRFCSQI